MSNPNYAADRIQLSGGAMRLGVPSLAVSSGAYAPTVEQVSLNRIADELRATIDLLVENGKGLMMIRERVFGSCPIPTDPQATGLESMSGATAEVLHLVRLLALQVEFQRGEIGALSNI